jgi:hypothetical protein
MHIIWLIICMYYRIWDVTGHGTRVDVWRGGFSDILYAYNRYI